MYICKVYTLPVIAVVDVENEVAGWDVEDSLGIRWVIVFGVPG